MASGWRRPVWPPLLALACLACLLCGRAGASCSPTSAPIDPQLFQNSSFLSAGGTRLTLLFGTSQLYASTRVYLLSADSLACNNQSRWSAVNAPTSCLQLLSGSFDFPAVLDDCGFFDDPSLGLLGWTVRVSKALLVTERHMGSFAGVPDVDYEDPLVATVRLRHPSSVEPSAATLQVDAVCSQRLDPPQLDAELSGLDSTGTLSVGMAAGTQFDVVTYRLGGLLCPASWERRLLGSGCSQGHVLSLPLDPMLRQCWNAGVGTETFDQYNTQLCATTVQPVAPFAGSTVELSMTARQCTGLSLRVPARSDVSPDNAALTVDSEPGFSVRLRSMPASSRPDAVAPDLRAEIRVTAVSLDARPLSDEYSHEGLVTLVTSVDPRYELFSPTAVSFAPSSVLVGVSSDQAPPPAAVCKAPWSGASNCVQQWAAFMRPVLGHCHLNTMVDVFFRVRCAPSASNCSLPAGAAAPVVTFSLLPDSNSLCDFTSECLTFSDGTYRGVQDAFEQGETVHLRAAAVPPPSVVLQNSVVRRVTVATNGHRVLLDSGVITDEGSGCGFSFTNRAGRSEFAFDLTSSCVDLAGLEPGAHDVTVTADMEVDYRFADLSQLRRVRISPAAVFKMSVSGSDTEAASASGLRLGVPVIAGAGAGFVVLCTAVVIFVLYRRRKADRERDEFVSSSEAAQRLARLQVGSSSVLHSSPSMSTPTPNSPVAAGSPVAGAMVQHRYVQPNGQLVYQLALPAGAAAPVLRMAAPQPSPYPAGYELEGGYQQALPDGTDAAAAGDEAPEDMSYSDAGNTRASPAAAAAARVPQAARLRQERESAAAAAAAAARAQAAASPAARAATQVLYVVGPGLSDASGSASFTASGTPAPVHSSSTSGGSGTLMRTSSMDSSSGARRPGGGGSSSKPGSPRKGAKRDPKRK